MKKMTNVRKCLVSSGLALIVAAWAFVPSSTLAQEKGAQRLMKIQKVEDLQSLDKGDVIVMSCPKCKDTYAQVVEQTYKTVKPEELKDVAIHLCSTCDTTIKTKGRGKEATDTLVHTCKTCGSHDVTCCVIKKDSLAPAKGMTSN
jgi:hypothetical protein